MADDTRPTAPKPSPREERLARSAEALRANLKRRKAQGRARSAEAESNDSKDKDRDDA